MRTPNWFERLFFKRRLAALAAADAYITVLGERIRAAETTVVEQSASIRSLKNTLLTAEGYAAKAREQADHLVATNYTLRRKHELATSFNVAVNGKHDCCPCVKDLQKYSQDALATTGLTYKGLVEGVARHLATEESPLVKEFGGDAPPVALGLDEKRPGLPAVDLKKFAASES